MLFYFSINIVCIISSVMLCYAMLCSCAVMLCYVTLGYNKIAKQ